MVAFSRSRAAQPPVPLESFREAIHCDGRASDVVSKLLSLDPRDARRFVGEVTKTAYRRLHEVVTSTIDEIAQRAERGEVGSRDLITITRSEVIVRYQQARGQVPKEVADALLVIIDELKKEIQAAAKPGGRGTRGELSGALERARLILDAIAVLVYNYGKR
ncbi:MAG: hypothetical protein DRJ67_09780 [Thermoprotei archaeon]|nr:MAG: hypothetical protein DRJ67_09780 [Thermoprotei archaeon]